jgi:molybdate transport system substrate-binding protein
VNPLMMAEVKIFARCSPRTARAVFMALLLASGALCVHAAEVTVATAANFAAPMQRLAQTFEQRSGHRVRAAVGATGALYAQVRHGAPFQVFLSADDQTPARLEAEGLALPGTRFVYATGRLVLWSADPQRVDARGAVLTGSAPGPQTSSARLAIANPRTAPYGAAALQVLERLGVTARWQPLLAQGENIAQAHQFVATGNADMGFVAMSQIMQDGRLTKGSAWLVPPNLHSPLRQEATLLRKGEQNAAALALMAFLKTEEARAIIQSFGYEH